VAWQSSGFDEELVVERIVVGQAEWGRDPILMAPDTDEPLLVFGYVSLVLDALVEIASLGCREKQETLLVHQSCNT
jgi:hypothetical protein